MDSTGTMLHELKASVVMLERDMVSHTKVSDKLTETMVKIQEMNSSLCSMIKLHEQRHGQAEKIFEAFDIELKDIDQRIDKVLMDPENPWWMAKNPNAAATEDRLRKLEHWMWMVAGGAMVAGAALTLILNIFLK